MLKKIICRLFGHKGHWQQHAKPWRLFRRCERCDHIDYRLKPGYTELLGPMLEKGGYPELSKLFRDEGKR